MEITEASAKYMSTALSMQAQGNARVPERNRQIVAINNFLWRIDQLISRKDDVQAAKMLGKALGIASRMASPPPSDLALELQTRKMLLDERQKVLPFLIVRGGPASSPSAVSTTDSSSPYRFEVRTPAPPPTTTTDEQQQQYMHGTIRMRNMVFAQECGGGSDVFENDGRDFASTQILVWLGDALVGNARWWMCHDIDAQYPYAIIDRLFVNPEYRRRGVAKQLFLCVRENAKQSRLVVLLAIRNTPSMDALKQKILATKQYSVFMPNYFIQNSTMTAGIGFHVSLLEPLYAAM